MNLLEIYVSNITADEETEYKGIRKLIADTDCYGNKEYQKEIIVDEHNYKSIKEKGYYLG